VGVSESSQSGHPHSSEIVYLIWGLFYVTLQAEWRLIIHVIICHTTLGNIIPKSKKRVASAYLINSRYPPPLSSLLFPFSITLESYKMAGGRVLNTKTRGGNRQQPEQTTGEKIKENQRRLHAERAKAGMKKYENGNASNGDGAEKAVKKFESYRREEQLPRSIEDRRIHVDETRQSVILPIYGYAVPFHISTIKNVTKTDATDHMVLRINFQTPGQIAGKKEDMVS